MTTEAEVGADAEQDDQNREIYVETVGDDGNHIHVTHDLARQGRQSQYDTISKTTKK